MPQLNRAEEVISRLLGRYERRRRPRMGNPFRALVRTILSQNTSYRNVAKAYDGLDHAIGVEPKALAGAPVERIADAIRPAGMHNQRSVTLKRVAEAVLERFGGDLAPVLDMPYHEAREALMSLPGVGTKTADVVLMFDAGKEIVPVDRHIFRITKRLQLVPEKASYDEVRLALEAATPPGRHEDVHVLLIRFGREVCKAQRPRCPECFLRVLCPYARDLP